MKDIGTHSSFGHQHPKDDRVYDKRNEDSYQSAGKYPEPSVCTGCGAIFKHGHWVWGAAQANAHKHVCPACQRMHDKVPAAIVTLEGPFFHQHQQELLNMIHNTEAKQKSEHPLHRVMKISIEGEQVILQLTDVHLANGIVHALQHAYQGVVTTQYAENDNIMRADWKR